MEIFPTTVGSFCDIIGGPNTALANPNGYIPNASFMPIADNIKRQKFRTRACASILFFVAVKKCRQRLRDERGWRTAPADTLQG